MGRPSGCLLLILAPLTVVWAAQEIRVKPDETGAPVIGPEIRDAAPGATIRLAKGTSREYVVISKPLSLAGDEGAVIDPSQPLRPHDAYEGRHYVGHRPCRVLERTVGHLARSVTCLEYAIHKSYPAAASGNGNYIFRDCR